MSKLHDALSTPIIRTSPLGHCESCGRQLHSVALSNKDGMKFCLSCWDAKKDEAWVLGDKVSGEDGA